MTRHVFLVCLLVCIAGLVARADEPQAPQPPLPKQRIVIVTADDGRHPFDVEVANTPAEQRMGLMFRKSVPEDGGMLFNWGRPWRASMWMKNTLVPLDMLFVRPDGRIDTAVRNAAPESETLIRSRDPVSVTIELRGGTIDRLKIREGDKVVNLPPPPPLRLDAVQWPDFQASLSPGPSASTVPARLPPGLHVDSAGPEVPAARRALLGRWSGWMGRERTGSIELLVQRLTDTGAVVVYANADGARHIPNTVQTLSMQQFGDRELRGFVYTSGGDAILALRLRPDGAMDIMLNEGFLWVTGVLERSPI
jgi:uncharacterized protein